MAVPEFVLTLRAKIGQDPLPLLGVIAVVLDDEGRVLMVRRSDNHRWTLVTGCVDPGEQPAVTAVREVEEETGVDVRVERLLAVEARDLAPTPNGDQVWWTSIAFRCRFLGGEAKVNDDESIDVRWWPVTQVPSLPPHQARALELALDQDAEPFFVR